jgi:hypothetical protein
MASNAIHRAQFRAWTAPCCCQKLQRDPDMTNLQAILIILAIGGFMGLTVRMGL